MDKLASEYGWPLSDIEDLTYRRMNSLIDAIDARKLTEEYIGRLHAGVGAMATVKALSAALAKAEITLEELVGKPLEAPQEAAVAVKDAEETLHNAMSDQETISAWKEIAEQRGLKTS